MIRKPIADLSDRLGKLLGANELYDKPVCGRYAPSPSGALHLGNLRTALLAWRQARDAGGRFIIRMDDLDQPRVKPGSAEQILDDLRWLGIDWDEGPDIDGPHAPYAQSQRTTHYEAAFQQLKAQGLAYPCTCSRKDIQEATRAPHSGQAPNIYPNTCRPPSQTALDAIDTSANTATPNKTNKNLPAAWRFRVSDETITFEDQILGEVSQHLPSEVGDFVIKRKDGFFAYQLASVVDDIKMGVTDVVRGEDLLDSTPRQIALFYALGAKPPRFWHVPLMRNEAGEKLSKRDGSDSRQALETAEIGRAEIIAMLNI